MGVSVTPLCAAEAAQKPEKELVLTSEELRLRPELTGIDGVLYDLKAFAPHHPGGEVIQSAGAYDASALYRSMHPGRDPAKSVLLRKFRVGTHVRSLAPKEGATSATVDTIFTYDSPFAVDVISSVKNALAESKQSWYAGPGFWARTLLICVGTLVAEYYWATTGALYFAVLAGILHAQIGLAVQHDGSHGAISANPRINAFFAYGADWIGSCRWIWLEQHVLWHHPYTNVHGKDVDAGSAEPLIVFHDYSATGSKGEPPKSPLLGMQRWFTNMVLMFYGPSIVLNAPQLMTMRHSDLMPEAVTKPGSGFIGSQRLCSILFRLFYFLRVMIAPAYLAGQWMIAGMIPCTVCGAILTFVFVLSHNFEGADRDPLSHGTAKDAPDGKAAAPLLASEADSTPACWYKMQVETSSTYGGWLYMFLTGGLNFQIEHHIFPRLSSWQYPRIRPVVQACCERHGVKYNYFPTLGENLASMLNYMQKVGVVAVIRAARED